MAPLPSGNNERAKEKEMDKKLRVLRVSCAALARPLARATFVDSRAIDRSMEQPKLSCSIVVLQGFGCASSPPTVIKAPGQFAQVALQR